MSITKPTWIQLPFSYITIAVQSGLTIISLSLLMLLLLLLSLLSLLLLLLLLLLLYKTNNTLNN